MTEASSVARNPHAGVKVEEQDGCSLIYGPIPISELQSFALSAPPGSIISPHLARLAGASFAFGPSERIFNLIAKLRAHREKHTTSEHLSAEANRWLAVGEQGASSVTMFWVFTGIRAPGSELGDAPCAHPLDPDDLRRCRLLLEQVPEFVGKLPQMRAVSAVWSRLIDAWDELCALMDTECPQWRGDSSGAAELTYERMREIIDLA